MICFTALFTGISKSFPQILLETIHNHGQMLIQPKSDEVPNCWDARFKIEPPIFPHDKPFLVIVGTVAPLLGRVIIELPLAKASYFYSIDIQIIEERADVVRDCLLENGYAIETATGTSYPLGAVDPRA